MKKIALTRGYFALVDDKDYPRLMQGPKWQAAVVKYKDGSVRNVYAVRSVWLKPKNKQVQQCMHRFILSIVNRAVYVDHRDNTGTNNQRYNLRVADAIKNQRNSIR